MTYQRALTISARLALLVAAAMTPLSGCGDGDAASPSDAGASADFEGCLQDPIWTVRPAYSSRWNLDGPPMVAQVFVTNGSRAGLVFGSYPGVATDPSFLASPGAYPHIRVVLDEPVKGSSISEVACHDGSYSGIPDGTTDEQIRACTWGPYEQCESVCADGDWGILQDYYDTQMIDADHEACTQNFSSSLACLPPVRVVCDGRVVPLERHLSGLRTNGTQRAPAGATVAELLQTLGPAIYLSPDDLPAGAECTIEFAPEVTDCDGNPVCAPPDGDYSSQPCVAPNDTSEIRFRVEPLGLAQTDPMDGAVDVPLERSGEPTRVLLRFNAKVHPDTASAIYVEADGLRVPNVTASASSGEPDIVVVSFGDAHAPDTEYVVRVPVDVADRYGSTLEAPLEVRFRTAAAQ